MGLLLKLILTAGPDYLNHNVRRWLLHLQNNEEKRNLNLGGHVGFDSLPDQLVSKSVTQGFCFNILCVGETGIGKSTLMNTLFNTMFENEEASHYQNGVYLRPRTTYDLQESNVHLKLTIVDTVGFGDQINKEDSYKPIVDYIDTQFENYLQEELKIKRSLFNYHDTRIHICLYFIAPTGHSLKSLDLVTMKKNWTASSCIPKAEAVMVNIIPIIAKADTISKSELHKFKIKIMSELVSNGVQIYQFPTDDEAVSEINASMNAHLPFAVVGSVEEVKVGNKTVRARQYPWGVVQGGHGFMIFLRKYVAQCRFSPCSPASLTLTVCVFMWRFRHIKGRPKASSLLLSLHPQSSQLVVVFKHCIHPTDIPGFIAYAPGPERPLENESHCDFVKLREMLIRVNMEDLREQTHARHYELYRRCKLEEMGFKDTDPDSQPFSLQETYEAKRKEFLGDLQRKEEEMRQMFVNKVKETEAELKEKERELHDKFEQLKRMHQEEKRKVEEKRRDLEEEMNAFNRKKVAAETLSLSQPLKKDKDKKKSPYLTTKKECVLRKKKKGMLYCISEQQSLQQIGEDREPVGRERLQLQSDDGQGQRGALELPKLVAGHTVLHLPGPQRRLEAWRGLLIPRPSRKQIGVRCRVPADAGAEPDGWNEVRVTGDEQGVELDRRRAEEMKRNETKPLA
ncbi:hypothetical protein L3Q82_022425 [Scortum barcoo]|uniref:Uncharacterized protein n=1 Tax=Scortum barcoo TaxID=214431 RepID=A0ACB8X199_9TELE|nr:hypothetical protein L3Q82_022425 [Scortum barcoo]